MPMTFSDERVLDSLRRCKLSELGTGEDRRNRLARYVEEMYGDYVEGWEIRTGKPWNKMTSVEAKELVDQYPQLIGNPGIISRLVSK